jgi:glutamate/aspartate transport system substrate-binding protein
MIRSMMLLLATLLLATPALGAELDGTLKKIKAANTITFGYRDDARPFAFTGDDGKPAGYSIDLCTRIAADVAKELALPNLQVKWVKVTPATRIQSVANGTVDLECGSTTASLSRQEQVDFSLMTFIDGGSLLVTDASGIRGISTLGGKRVAVVPGTTTEKALREALAKRGVGGTTVVPVKNHAEGVAALDNRTIDVYASDRVILIGMGRMSKNPEKLSLVEEFFSYEPHGFMLKRGDAAFRLSVNRSLAAMYRSGEVAPMFEKAFGSMTTAAPIILNMYLMNGLPE